MSRWVLHVDLDQFIAAVEILRNPELKGKPVVVGGTGDPTRARTVVATASYEAREYGVHSGMPMRTAARKCPDAVFLPSDNPAYEAASAEVMTILAEFGDAVEVIGWDEAFIAVDTDDPESTAAAIQRAVVERTDLTCAVGIGDNKVRAKIATGFGKPGGMYRLTEATWFEVMGHRPTDALWGLGGKTAAKLTELGITTVTELAAADRDVLAKRFGPRMGPWFRVLAHGYGEAEVSRTPWVPRSRSRETTFPRNLEDPGEIRDAVVRLAHQVADDVRAEDRPAVRVGIKVRFAPFLTQTRSVGLARAVEPADAELESAIAEGALAALAKAELDRPVRLLGVRAEFPS